jgi:sugar phosphate isomerase/epimerase
MKNSRRQFFKKAGASMLALGVGSSFPTSGVLAADASFEPRKPELFKIGIAGWTFWKMKLEPALDEMEKAGVHYLCIKNFHLPYDATPDQIAEFHAKLKAKGVTGDEVGPVNMKSEAEVDQMFEYAKRVGVKVIAAVPTYEMLPYVNKKVKEFDMKVAIHNHGIGDQLYPSLKSIYDKVKDLDVRIGMCHDIGYTRQLGFDPAAETIKYANRIHDIHLKDIDSEGKDMKDVPVGRGIIDMPAFVKALRKIKYSSTVHLEYEKDPTDNLAGITESIGYFRGVIAGLG